MKCRIVSPGEEAVRGGSQREHLWSSDAAQRYRGRGGAVSVEGDTNEEKESCSKTRAKGRSIAVTGTEERSATVRRGTKERISVA